MDNITHALAGLLLAEATLSAVRARPGYTESKGFRGAMLAVGVIAAELPDIDLVYAGPLLGMGKLGYLLHHRGHTHTVVFALLSALLIWGITLAFKRGGYERTERWGLLAIAMMGSLSHIALDYTNNYGVHPFWPFENSWYYGDAVFIIEPWLWIVAIPALVLLARRMATRVGLSLALLGILGLAWRIDMISREVAIAFTIGAIVWWGVTLLTPHPWRVALAIAAWVVVEGMFFAASHAARANIREAVGSKTFVDVALTAAVGDPTCFEGLVMERDGETYRVTSARIATMPGLRDVSACRTRNPLHRFGTSPSPRRATSAVHWGWEWNAPIAQLHDWNATRCDVAAALRFIRVPIWQMSSDSGIYLADARFDRGAGAGFASVEFPQRSGACPRYVPPWNPPRARLVQFGR